MSDAAPDHPLPGASLPTAFARFWQRYAVFSGRASRSEYWWAVLALAVVGIALGLLIAVVLGIGGALAGSGSSAVAVTNALGAVLVLLLVVFVLAQIVPSIALTVRRLHDADFSGWLYLLSFIPSVGGLIVLVFTVLPSNPSGRRFDRDAPRWTPAVGAAAAAAAAPAAFAFDAWPAPAAAHPVTAPMPQQQLEEERDEPPRDEVWWAWTEVGGVQDVDARLAGQPSWRRVRYLLIERPDGIGVLSTSGLAEAEGAAALGPGAELYLASTALAGAGGRAADGWEFALLASAARRIGASGMRLPAELEQHGALSMAVPVQGAPAGWTTEDGAVGLLIGLPLQGVPATVSTPTGEVRLVGVAPLRPAELQRILDGGRAARTAIAGDLAALPASRLASPERPEV